MMTGMAGISHYLDSCDEYLAKSGCRASGAGQPLVGNWIDDVFVLSGGAGGLHGAETEDEQCPAERAANEYIVPGGCA